MVCYNVWYMYVFGHENVITNQMIDPFVNRLRLVSRIIGKESLTNHVNYSWIILRVMLPRRIILRRMGKAEQIT